MHRSVYINIQYIVPLLWGTGGGYRASLWKDSDLQTLTGDKCVKQMQGGCYFFSVARWCYCIIHKSCWDIFNFNVCNKTHRWDRYSETLKLNQAHVLGFCSSFACSVWWLCVSRVRMSLHVLLHYGQLPLNHVLPTLSNNLHWSLPEFTAEPLSACWWCTDTVLSPCGLSRSIWVCTSGFSLSG